MFPIFYIVPIYYIQYTNSSDFLTGIRDRTLCEQQPPPLFKDRSMSNTAALYTRSGCHNLICVRTWAAMKKVFPKRNARFLRPSGCLSWCTCQCLPKFGMLRLSKNISKCISKKLELSSKKGFCLKFKVQKQQFGSER